MAEFYPYCPTLEKEAWFGYTERLCEDLHTLKGK